MSDFFKFGNNKEVNFQQFVEILKNSSITTIKNNQLAMLFSIFDTDYSGTIDVSNSNEKNEAKSLFDVITNIAESDNNSTLDDKEISAIFEKFNIKDNLNKAAAAFKNLFVPEVETPVIKDENLIENAYLDITYPEEIYQKMAGNKEFTEKYQQEEIDKYRKKLEEKYPAPEYIINISRSEKGGIQYSVYKSENAGSKIADRVLSGNLEAFDDIENPITFLEEINKASGGESAYSVLLSNLQEGTINKNEFLSYLKTLDSKIFDYQDNYNDKIQTDGYDSKHNHLLDLAFSNIVQSVKDLFERSENLQNRYKSGELDRTEILKLQKHIKENYKFDLSEVAIAGIIDLKQYENKSYKAIAASFKEKDFFAGNNFTDFVNNILIYNGYNDSLETIAEKAKITEQEYSRYNFDIKNSSIADIQKKSLLIRNKAEKNIEVQGDDNKVILKDKSTGEIRTIDLKALTAKMNDKGSTAAYKAIQNMPKIMQWEFALEHNSILPDNAAWGTGGEYDKHFDRISINASTTSYTLSHETIHALMATVINGENTFNEDLSEELKQTYEKELEDFKKKELSSRDGEFRYCAENLHEFAAEAGVLYLTGESGSAYTIAKHFPRSYRLLVGIIDKIREQKTNRSYEPYTF